MTLYPGNAVDNRVGDSDVPTERVVAMLDAALVKLEAVQRARSEPIAIVGLACRFPSADSAEAYWRLLRDGVDATGEVPPDRWDAAAWFDADADAAGRMYVRRGGFLTSVDGFDARFFDISPREAASMDPQQRLLLEVAWEALEHAGIAPAAVAGSAGGVFIGLTTNDYASLLAGEGPASLDAYFSTGNALNAAPGRLAHILDLHGPCLAVDTACSSSLVAVHMACQSLRAGESDLALAGGVNLILSPAVTVAICRAKMLAPDGRCKTFDASADGYVRAEGCGVVVLKRLSDAVSAGDRVLALIRGSAVNQDGATAGFTVPSGRAQESLIRRALGNACVEPGDIDYLEAHGTGTALGDPIELLAAAAALGAGRSPDQKLLIGSVKTNFGHAEAAAGIAGLIKVVLALNHSEIPRHLHFKTPNPHVAWSDLPLAVATNAQPWAAQGRPRRAGINAFGASGTNAHLVVQEAPVETCGEAAQVGPDRPLHILALSARTEAALRALTLRYADHLLAHPEQAWPDICHTANVGRAHLPHRIAIVAATAAAAAARLRSVTAHPAPTEAPKIAFLFSGDGSHYAGMGELLYATQPSFRRTLDRCSEILRDRMKPKRLDVLFAPGSTWLDQATWAEPALFALQVAVAELWRSWGVHPVAVFGYGVGEYAAACVAGVFSLEDGLLLVSRRAELLGRLAADGAGLALHSPPTEPVLADFAQAAGSVRYREPTIPVVTDHAGEAATGAIVTPGYWVRELCEAGRFADGLAALRQRGCDAFVEVGPARTLLDLAGKSLADDALLRVPSLLATATGAVGSDWETMLEGLGRLYERGVAIDWGAFDQDRRRARLALPTYPWQHVSHWRPSRSGPLPTGPVLAAGDDDLLYEVVWRPQDPPALPPTDFLAPIGRLASGLRSTLGACASAQVPESYVRAVAALEDVSADYVALAWHQLGWRFTAGMRCSDAELAGRLGVLGQHGRLIARMAAILGEAGWLVRDNDGWRVTAHRDPRDPAQRLTVLGADAPAECALLARCGRSLAEVLRGLCDPLELLFPADGSVSAASLYRDAPGAVLMNRLLQQAVAQAVSDLPPGRRLRVLEIGAGTGGTTAALLAVLPPERTDYLFTDISPHFIAAARGQFQNCDWLRCQVLDIECDPEAQGFADEAPFDIIVAANVLHATRDLRQSLRHVRRLAQPGALLLLLEGTAPIRSVDLVFGLTEGWWRFVDDRIDSAYPLIGTADWISALRNSGFDDADAVALDPVPWGVLSRQAVLLARASETVRPHWLIVEDRGGIGRVLAERHRNRGGTAVLIAPDAELAEALDPSRPCEIIYLRGLDEPALDPRCPDAAPEVGQLACTDVADLVRILADAAPVHRLCLVTRGATGGTPAAQPGLAQSGLWGLARVIAREHPELRPVRIDLDPDADGDTAAMTLWDALSAGTDEDEIRLCGGIRAVSRLVRSPPPPASPAAFRNDAAYLITGGLGGLGLLTARWMVERGARTIVLAGRRDAGGSARKACGELEAAGARIVVRQADIAREADAQALLDAFGRSLPPLRGIVHAAGVLDDGAVRHLTWQRFTHVLRPKVAGAWNLHQLTTGMELDFFVLYSSFTAVLGTPGQGNHAAANAFLDALAWHRSGLGLPALSIGWGAWSGVGAAAERDVGERLRKGVGMLAPEQGLRLLERVWRSTRPQIGIVPIQWQQLERHELARRLLSDFATASPRRAAAVAAPNGVPTGDILARWRAAPPERRKSVLVEYILAEAASVLGHRDADELAPLQGFFELGMDSLTSVELRNRLRTGLGCELPTTIAFDCPNADALADYLLDRLEAPARTAPARTAPVGIGPEAVAAPREDHVLTELSIGELESMIDAFTGSA